MKKLLCMLLMISICFSTAIGAFATEKNMLGDINLDDTISVIDATELQCHLAQLKQLSDHALAVADVSGDQDINIIDATFIQQYIAKIINEFPAQRTKVYGVQAEATSTSTIRVSWGPINGAQKYWIYVNDVVRMSTTDNSITFNCGDRNDYEIKVTAMLADGTILNPDNADTVFVSMDAIRNNKVQGVKASHVTHDSITLSWNSNPEYSKYWIYVNDVIYSSTTETSYTIANLSSETTYKIYVVALRNDNVILTKDHADILTITTKPDKIESELEILAKKIENLQTDSTLTLSVFADMHYDENSNIASLKNQRIEEMGQLQSLVNVDYVTNLGDLVVGDVDKKTTVTSLNTLINLTETASNSPVLNVRGNHDDNGWYSYGGYGGTYKQDEIINDVEWYNLAMNNLPQDFVTDKNNPYGGYGYIDHEKSKIRIFMLNSCDIPYILNEDGSYRYSSYTGHAFSNEQLNFVADALHFDDKDNPDEWAALFLTHVPLDTSNADGERFGGKSALIRGHDYLLSIISAYRKGTSFKASGSVYIPSYPNDKAEDFMVDVDVDYSQKGCGEVIAFLNGHTHRDNYTNKAGIENSLSYGYTFIGTSGGEGFANLVINREQKTISVIKHGTVYPEKTEGTIVTAPDTGSIESGEWSVKYDQFLPDKTNLSNGLSQTNELYYSFDSAITTGIDKQTMEVLGSSKVTTPIKLTKAIAVKPMTTYILPDDFKGTCLTFAKDGTKRVYLNITENNDKNTITTAQHTVYVAFALDTNRYKDYINFSIFEECSSTK